MRLQSVLRPRPLAVAWTVVCLILMLVGLATLVSGPSGNGDVVDAAASPGLTSGEVAALTAVLWVLGIVLLLAWAAVRRVVDKETPT